MSLAGKQHPNRLVFPHDGLPEAVSVQQGRRPLRQIPMRKATEQSILVLATAIELRIAKKVFGIRVTATITFSQTINRPMPYITSFDSSLFVLFEVPWHPRH
ncbi:hypothetical protein PT974_12359 [Cladobotryum mycophilum]|uniref:Uncharacterized protein n=1 Tax=Cladobotryum mycophilum TaxID=491253 RepID=A0ABR0S8C3_9HYPO